MLPTLGRQCFVFGIMTYTSAGGGSHIDCDARTSFELYIGAALNLKNMMTSSELQITFFVRRQ